MDTVLALHLVPVLVDGLILFGMVLSLILAQVPARWRTSVIAFGIVVTIHLVESLIEAFETDVGALLAPIVQSVGVIGLLIVAVIMWREILRPQRMLDRASRHRDEFEGSIDQAPAVILKLTRDGVVSHINTFGARLLRTSGGPLDGRDFFECCVSEESREAAREAFFAFVASTAQVHNTAEYRVGTLYGERSISWRLSPQFDSAGDVVGVIMYGEDVTEQRAAEAIMERYRILKDQSPDIILFIREADGRVIEANPAAEKAYGYLRDQLLALSITDLRDPDASETVPNSDDMISEAGVRFETVHRRSDGTTFPVEASVRATSSIEDQVVLLAIVRDISERKRAAAQRENDRRRLKELAKELTVSAERQRRILAQELHDRVSQPLAAAKLKLEVALYKLPATEEVPEFADTVGLIGDSISETRAITLETSPPLLYEVGLAPALEWLAAQQCKFGIVCSVDCEPVEGLDHDTRAFLFRATRELLANVVKHAESDRAQVTLRSEGDTVVLTVSDDGSGFDTTGLSALPDEKHGFGLFSIKEHAAAMGAEMTIDSSPGSGTTVTLRVPVSATAV